MTDKQTDKPVPPSEIKAYGLTIIIGWEQIISLDRLFPNILVQNLLTRHSHLGQNNINPSSDIKASIDTKMALVRLNEINSLKIYQPKLKSELSFVHSYIETDLSV